MQDLSREHEERIKVNQQLCHEIENMKVQIREVEKNLTSIGHAKRLTANPLQ